MIFQGGSQSGNMAVFASDIDPVKLPLKQTGSQSELCLFPQEEGLLRKWGDLLRKWGLILDVASLEDAKQQRCLHFITPAVN